MLNIVEKKPNNTSLTDKSKDEQPPKSGSYSIPPWKLKTQNVIHNENVSQGKEMSTSTPNQNEVSNSKALDKDDKPSIVSDSRKYKLKRIGVFSTGKVYSVFGFFMGIIVAIVFLITFLVTGSSGSSTHDITASGAATSSFFSSLGIVFILIIPFFYAVLCFIVGALGALALNLAFKLSKGLEIELEQE